MRRTLRAAATAVAFLTRIPCPVFRDQEPGDFARATTWFPLVGAVVGLWGGLLFAAAAAVWPALVAAVISTAGTVWLTGALHEDAVADAFDGFGGGGSPEQVLLIMKDSRVGSFGVVALALQLLAKVGVLASLPTGTAVRALVAAHVLGRWSSLVLLWRYDYVQHPGAKSRAFARGVSPAELTVGSIAALGIVWLSIGAAPARSIAAVLLAIAVAATSGRYFRRRIGGITGDCLGLACQLVELGTYLTLAWRVGG